MLLALVLAALALVRAHPDSLSATRLVVDGGRVHASLKLQVASLREVLPGLDLERDGRVGEEELALFAESIADYVAAHWSLESGADRALQGGRALRVRARSLALVPEDERPFRERAWSVPTGWIAVTLELEADAPLEDLVVESHIFQASSPGHVEIVTLDWGALGEDVLTLDAEHPRARSDPRGRGAFGAFFPLGVHHILSGWDHLAFLAALVLGARRARSLLGIVTAFTVAHSLSLAAAALGLVDGVSLARWIEPAIALSIAFVAADVLLRPARTRARWIEAFAFGLVHGLGFAGFLGEALGRERAKLPALAGFNLGVEAGQLLVVGTLALLVAALPRRVAEDPPLLAPRLARRAGAGLLLALGLVWFVQRLRT